MANAMLDKCRLELAGITGKMRRSGYSQEDIQLVNDSYDTVEEWQGSQLRKSGEPYVMHLIRVAKRAYRARLSSSVISAALMHDLIEDTPYGMADPQYWLEHPDEFKRVPKRERLPEQIGSLRKQFGDRIAGMVDAVSEIENEINMSTPNIDWKDFNTYNKLIAAEPQYREAYYIKLFDRIDNLTDRRFAEGDPASRKGMQIKAAQTERYLIPIARKMYAHELVLQLEDLCFQILDPERYRQIYLAQQFELMKYEESCDNIEKQLLMLAKNDRRLSDDIYVVRVENKGLFPAEVRKLQPESQNDSPSGRLGMVAPYEMPPWTLKNEQSILIPLTSFFVIYNDLEDHDAMVENFFARLKLLENIAFLHYEPYKRFEPAVFWVQDRFANLHKIYVLDEREYYAYRYGDTTEIEIPSFSPSNDGRTISVIKLDGNRAVLPSGSRVLDFAFSISERVAIYAYGAEINGEETQMLDRELRDGDRVKILTYYEKGKIPIEKSQANFEWFVYANNPETRLKLLRHFEKIGFPIETIGG